MTKLFTGIRSRVEKATEGPWQVEYKSVVDCVPSDGRNFDKRLLMAIGLVNESNNITFAAHSRTDIPKLLRAVDILVEALKYYSDMPIATSQYGKIGISDHGEKAKSALEAVRKLSEEK
jgi:hypothetical protein